MLRLARELRFIRLIAVESRERSAWVVAVVAAEDYVFAGSGRVTRMYVAVRDDIHAVDKSVHSGENTLASSQGDSISCSIRLPKDKGQKPSLLYYIVCATKMQNWERLSHFQRDVL